MSTIAATNTPRMPAVPRSHSVLATRSSAMRTPRRPLPPAPASAVHLAWDERVVTTAQHSVQLTIPLVGRCPDGLAADLALDLDRLWTDRRTASGSRITSVATVIGRRDGHHVLVIFLTVDALPVTRRLDDRAMERQLRGTLQRLLTRHTSDRDVRSNERRVPQHV